MIMTVMMTRVITRTKSVRGNEQANKVARTASITTGLQLRRAEVLRGLRNFLKADRPGHLKLIV